MNWFVRLGYICVVLTIFCACDPDDVGKPCKLTQAENVKNLKELGDKARIVEASAVCDLQPFCFANYYDADKDNKCPPDQPNCSNNSLGYCSKICDPEGNDCPKGYTCEVFVKASTLPASHQQILAPIQGKAICIKTPPTE